MDNGIKKIIDLIQKTGDRFIVMDKNDTPYVIMSFNDYERLARPPQNVRTMSEGELLDKINRDIAMWRSEHDYDFEDEEDEEDDDDEMEDVGDHRDDWDMPGDDDRSDFPWGGYEKPPMPESDSPKKEEEPAEEPYLFEPLP